MENRGYVKQWNSTSGHALPRRILLSSSSVTSDLGSLIRQLLYLYVEKQGKCRATNMQIRNAPWAALPTVEWKSRSFTQSCTKAHVVSNVSVHTFSFQLKVLQAKDISNWIMRFFNRVLFGSVSLFVLFALVFLN